MVLIIFQIVGERAAIGAALIPVGVAFGRMGGNPFFGTARSFDATEMQGYVLDVVHVVGEKEDCVTALAKEHLIVRYTAKVHVDVMRSRDGVLEGIGHRPGIVFAFANQKRGLAVGQSEQVIPATARRKS